MKNRSLINVQRRLPLDAPGAWLGVLLALLTVLPAALAERNPNPGIAPPQSAPHGKTYGEWGAEWWKWVLALPLNQSPVTDPTGARGTLNQSGPVWFLAGTFGQSVERTLTIPTGTALFFPLANIWNDYPCPDPNFQPPPGQTMEEFLAEGAAFWIDHVTALAAEVDGVPVQSLFDYRGVSPLTAFTADVSNVAIDPCINGEAQLGVSDGYWLMVTPLKPGQHTIHFSASIVIPEWDLDWSLDVTYHLTVK